MIDLMTLLRTSNSLMTLENALSDPKFDVSKQIVNFWNNLYDADEVDICNNTLRVGSLIHHDNTPSIHMKDLYVRRCYKDLYDNYIVGEDEYDHLFFTGTAGVGKSVFRSYVVWKQIQFAKKNAQSCIILMSKSQKTDTVLTQLLVINEGIMSCMKKLLSTDTITLSQVVKILYDIEDEIPLYHHVDVSEGESSTSIGKMKRNFYYTSLNEKAWKEKMKISGILCYLPTWHLDELIEFYVNIGWRNNPVLTNRLLIEVQSQNRITNNQISYLMAFPDEERYKFVVNELEYSISQAKFIAVIKTEADTYGYIPRNLFLKENALEYYCKQIYHVIQNSMKTIEEISQVVSFSNKNKHKLLCINPVVLDADNKINYCKYSMSWLGTFVTTTLINSILFKHHKQLTENYFSSKVLSIITLDLKLNECLALGLFALHPTFFQVVSIKQQTNDCKGDINHPIIKTERIDNEFAVSKESNSEISSPQIRVMNNEQFKNFVLNVEQVGMACLINSQYPATDGVMHLLMDDGVRITAFMQVMTSTLYEICDEAAHSLKSLIDGILEHHPNHQIVFFWMNFGTKHPDKNLNYKLKQNIPHYHIRKATDIPTESQQQFRSRKRRHLDDIKQEDEN